MYCSQWINFRAAVAKVTLWTQHTCVLHSDDGAQTKIIARFKLPDGYSNWYRYFGFTNQPLGQPASEILRSMTAVHKILGPVNRRVSDSAVSHTVTVRREAA